MKDAYLVSIILIQIKEANKMIPKEEYEICKDCPYYFGVINKCMLGEDDVHHDLERKVKPLSHWKRSKDTIISPKAYCEW